MKKLLIAALLVAGSAMAGIGSEPEDWPVEETYPCPCPPPEIAEEIING